MSRFVLGFSDPATPMMEGIIDLHNYIFFYLILVLVIVLWMSGAIIHRYIYLVQLPFTHRQVWTLRRLMRRFRHKAHSTRLELFWTIVPSIILIYIAIPSFALLYALDEAVTPSITIKVVGSQWYWSYEYSDYIDISFDSNIIFENDLTIGEHRLLTVDNQLVLPEHLHIRFLITSNDVIHSFSIPNFGIKTDAVPGRLNQTTVFLKRQGVFYGSCSELCGVNHGFMPAVVKVATIEEFNKFIQDNSQLT